jgi:hypothetical protein
MMGKRRRFSFHWSRRASAPEKRIEVAHQTAWGQAVSRK